MNASAVSLEELVEAAVESHRGVVGALMPVLHAIQERLGYIPSDAVPMIARSLGLSRAEVHGMIGFYHDFRSEPPGEHIVHLCRAEACQAMGSRALEQHAREMLFSMLAMAFAIGDAISRDRPPNVRLLYNRGWQKSVLHMVPVAWSRKVQ